MDTNSLSLEKRIEPPLNNTIHLNLSVIRQKIKTRERNKLKNLFLENENIEKLLCFLYEKNIKYQFTKVEFESLFNWNIVISGLSFRKLQCEYDYENMLPNVYIEIEPLLGDDYPCVLQKMEYQKELTLNNSENKKNDMSGKVKESCNFVLLIEEYNSTNTPKDALIKIFKQSDINIVFINELKLKNEPLQKNISETEKEIVILQEEIKESLSKTEKNRFKMNEIINELIKINDVNVSNKNDSCRIL